VVPEMMYTWIRNPARDVTHWQRVRLHSREGDPKVWILTCPLPDPSMRSRVRHLKETAVRKSRLKEAPNIAVLREQEAGELDGKVCRRHGIGPQPFRRWNAKYSGMDVSDAQSLQTLKDENHCLKKLLAQSMQDVAKRRPSG